MAALTGGISRVNDQASFMQSLRQRANGMEGLPAGRMTIYTGPVRSRTVICGSARRSQTYPGACSRIMTGRATVAALSVVMDFANSYVRRINRITGRAGCAIMTG